MQAYERIKINIGGEAGAYPEEVLAYSPILMLILLNYYHCYPY